MKNFLKGVWGKFFSKQPEQVVEKEPEVVVKKPVVRDPNTAKRKSATVKKSNPAPTKKKSATGTTPRKRNQSRKVD